MSGIIHLSSDDFIIRGAKSKTLGISVEGNVLVFFKMKCENCKEFEPVFVTLAKKERRVKCAVLDITKNRDVVMSSRETNTPINAVPIIILYVNGHPRAKFSGTKNIPSITKFITDALQTVAAPVSQPSGQSFMKGAPHGGKVRVQESSNGKAWIPEIGAAPSMKGIIKGAGGRSGGGYSHGANIEDEDEPRLMIPDSVIPHNAPWEADAVNE